MDLHHHSYRNDEFTKMNKSFTIPCLTTTNVYRFFDVIFNVSLLKNTGSIPYN